MRLDHIAYRTADRNKTSQFFIDAFGYKIANEFKIVFDDESTAKCIALQPPEKIIDDLPWTCGYATASYHMAPEVFVSDGTPESIVGKWVAAHDNIGGVHHLAYQVDDVRAVAKEWLDKGWSEFSGDVLTCPEDDLDQVFTKPHPMTGVIYEFIKRGKHGFCEKSVKSLMLSTKQNK